MKLQLNRHVAPRAFRSPADFARFAEAQQAKFEALRGNGSHDFDWWANGIAAHWAAAAAAARAEGATEATIQRSLTPQPTVTIESRIVAVAQRLTRMGQRQAGSAIISFLNGEVDGQAGNHVHIMTLNAFSQYYTALAFETAPKGGPDQGALEAAIQSHEDRLSDILDADAKEIEQARQSFATMTASAEKTYETLSNRAIKLIDAAKDKWAKTHGEFVEQLATETAVELWRTRSTNHETRYRSFRKGTLWFGGLGLLLTLVWIFAGFAAARWAFPDDKTAQIASYTAGSLALFTLFVWGLRVLIRSMMSEDHLATDASARSALAHTYLALTKEQAATPEDRAIILATLFAPVSDGLVKDDGMPVFSPTAMAAQMITK